MAYLSDFDISGYGLSAQRFRMNIISSNIANAHTTRTAEGGPYRRKEVVFKEIEFDKELNNQINSKNEFLENENPLDDIDAPRFPKPAVSTVIIDKIVRDDKDFKLKFDPTHPDANDKGYVMLPNINPVIEMADSIEATRAYQANVSAFQSAKAIATSAIDTIKG